MNRKEYTMTKEEIVRALRACDETVCQDCPLNEGDKDYVACTRRAASLIESLTAENARLTTERDESQRRADAAVEDMKVGWLCRACIKRVKGKEWCNCHAVNFVNGPEKTTTCDNFDWRGPQAGEVNQDG